MGAVAFDNAIEPGPAVERLRVLTRAPLMHTPPSHLPGWRIIELGALGEFLGSIGVIATLIYLAIQIRQNTRTMNQGQRVAMAQVD